ncbi:hypothetical protein LXL04_002720 [Taraxacum kok-saghyz]
MMKAIKKSRFNELHSDYLLETSSTYRSFVSNLEYNLRYMWKNKPGVDMIWEVEDDMRARYPQLFVTASNSGTEFSHLQEESKDPIKLDSETERERRDGREGDRAPPGRSRRKRKKRERPRTAATTIAAAGDPRTAAATRRRRTYGKLSVSPLCGSSSCNLFPVMADSDLSCATGDSLGSEGCRLSTGISVFYLAGIAFCRQIIPIFDSHEID